MEFLNLDIKVSLYQDIFYKDLPEKLSSVMNLYCTATEKLKEFHKTNKFKFYVYSLFYPIEKDKIYKKGKTYNFTLRFMNKKIAADYCNALLNLKNSYFNIQCIIPEVISNTKKINSIKSITSAISVITENGVTRCIDTNHMDLNFIKKRIIQNTNKKYNELTKFDTDNYDFIESIEILNRKSFVFNYKSKYLIGNKFKINIKKDSLSQDLAFTILGSGLLEKNSLSYGFCEVC